MKVALVCMPFADVRRPAVGISLLKAELLASGVQCDIVYLNMRFARKIGLPDYRFIAESVSWRALATEWVFARSLYSSRPTSPGAYSDEVLVRQSGLPPGAVDRVLEVEEEAGAFIDECAVDLPWGDYDVVGFTSYSGQNLASLALARRIKQQYPDVILVFGGRNWEAEMGRELHRQFTFVDLVCSGEADVSFPRLVQALANGGAGTSRIGGLVVRSGGRTRSTGPAPTVRDMDALPVPDYDDFFLSLRETGYEHQFVPALAMEYSRGCWWAAQRPCAFCGLNGSRTTYRSKSPERFLAESRSLVADGKASYLELVDMVVPPAFFSRVLPELEVGPLPVRLWIQVRATIGREHLERMRRAGIEVQCGIESLSQHVLTLTNKGATLLENVRFLKWCKAAGLEPTWPMLYGFPQEVREDYDEVCGLIPGISFLPPPSELGSVLVPRFSSYYADPSVHGLRRLRPLRPYRHLYPFSKASLRRVALFFSADGCDQEVRPEYLEALSRCVRDWRSNDGGSRGDLRGETTSEGLTITDTRTCAVNHVRTLDCWDEAIYRACDGIASRAELEALEEGSCHAGADLQQRLDRFVDCKLMLESEGRYLSLAVLDPIR